MEIDKRKDQTNAANQFHGYCEEYHDIDNIKLWYMGHWFNGLRVGYDERFDMNGILMWKFHDINGQEIGCEQHYNSQYFYKTPNIKFGEHITWK